MEAPSPTSNLNAELLKENKFIIQKSDTSSINIIVEINNDRFTKFININDEFWEKNKKYYQDSFELFIKTLKNTLINKNSELTYKIIKLNDDKINLKLSYSTKLFAFTTEIILVKIFTEKEELINKIDKLMKENKELKEKAELNNFNKNILYGLFTIIIITIVIINIYFYKIFNNIKIELNNSNNNLSDCKAELIEIDSAYNICQENLTNCLYEIEENTLIEDNVLSTTKNQLDIYDKKKKEYCFSLFSLNIGW